jgi:hypothetical protein
VVVEKKNESCHEPGFLSNTVSTTFTRTRWFFEPLIFTLDSKTVYLSTVHVEPPVADEVLLVKQGSVGTKEVILKEKKYIQFR